MTDNYEHTSSPSWEEQLRSQLAHAEAEPPADLWADIERDLAEQEGAAAKKGRVVPLYARLAGAAAVAALVVGIGLWRMLNTNDEQILEKPCAASSAALRPLAEHVKPIAQSPETSKSLSPRPPQKGGGPETSKPQNPETQPSLCPPAPSEQPTALSKRDEEGPSAKGAAEITVPATPHSRRQRGVSLAFHAGEGGALHELRSGSSYASDINILDSNNSTGNSSIPIYSPDDFYYYYVHDYPVKTAALVRWRFTDRLALDAGLSYTYLHSRITYVDLYHKSSWRGHQRVHYIGLPVSLNYSIVDRRHWNIYASAGGEVAKAVDVQWRTKQGEQVTPTDHPLQCSVSAAVGVQYNLSRYVGLYLQPSADYYFRNGSPVETYYTQHPFTPSLLLGLRFNVKP